ncbi:competence/damage-inducible protein A [Candidatus Desantisbacteria bacterium CG1_02_38_46]|uniref:CinA-like protein n=3 Tax=unclassified Candidatus Desantisiibacteriota TaxID=3106372 RepID=A0A2H9PC41_9BACT|nr:MAG: competence/damage-inducible protein A [Candidatus Desantisbacteria bacterium CG1_02_38_46]PIU50972.1 MAG: competence/damage-inducible protein A [Candidatus Desantisbacteria bacterium CG07_land_8_20_14_0_80_39_15]PIZ16588.1 MAG: competence/damage-inducible protein A [Candidatus Desantisbacteria bacterium CG_4_10_14_0_8_um_filter_39_17]
MKAALIVIGNEILIGDTVDTNAAYLGKKLSHIGVEVVFKSTVPDKVEDIKESFKTALNRAKIVIIVGGLGPTRDDVTREAVSDLLKKKLKFHRRLFRNIESFFQKRGVEIPSISIKQAFLPAGAKELKNTVGTAPGFLLKYRNKLIIVLPGPPREMKPMFEKIIPTLEEKLRNSPIVIRKILRTYGIGESSIEEGLNDIKNTREFEIGFQAHPGYVDIKLCARARNKNLANKIISKFESKIFKRFKNYIFSRKDENLEEIVGNYLRKKGQTLSIAESCSGGLISNLITNIPGASDYFKCSVISYSNEMKRKILNVPAKFLKKYGAVSSSVAGRMAEEIRTLTNTDIGLGITGIAGPSGGTKNKPVGLVYIALSTHKGTTVEKFNFYGERTQIKEKVALTAFSLLLKYFLSR